MEIQPRDVGVGWPLDPERSLPPKAFHDPMVQCFQDSKALQSWAQHAQLGGRKLLAEDGA